MYRVFSTLIFLSMPSFGSDRIDGQSVIHDSSLLSSTCHLAYIPAAYERKPRMTTAICSATLIRPDVLVAAAHCERFMLKALRENATRKVVAFCGTEKDARLVEIGSYENHPSFVKPAGAGEIYADHDVMLLKAREDVPAPPMELVESPSEARRLVNHYENTGKRNCYAAGYGIRKEAIRERRWPDGTGGYSQSDPLGLVGVWVKPDEIEDEDDAGEEMLILFGKDGNRVNNGDSGGTIACKGADGKPRLVGVIASKRDWIAGLDWFVKDQSYGMRLTEASTISWIQRVIGQASFRKPLP